MKKLCLVFLFFIQNCFCAVPALVSDQSSYRALNPYYEQEFNKAGLVIKIILDLSKKYENMWIYQTQKFDPINFPTKNGYVLQFVQGIPMFLHCKLGSWRFIHSTSVRDASDEKLRKECIDAFKARQISKEELAACNLNPCPSDAFYRLTQFGSQKLPESVLH